MIVKARQVLLDVLTQKIVCIVHDDGTYGPRNDPER